MKEYNFHYEKERIITDYHEYYTDSEALYKDICTFYQEEYEEYNQDRFNSEFSFVFDILCKMVKSYEYWTEKVDNETFKSFYNIDFSTFLYMITQVDEHLQAVMQQTKRHYQAIERTLLHWWEKQPDDWITRF